MKDWFSATNFWISGGVMALLGGLAIAPALAQSPPSSEVAPLFPPEGTVVPAGAAAEDGGERVEIALPELIDLVLQGNRDLQNQQLQRIVQRQQLSEAEQAFDPRLTPNLSIGLTQDFSGNGRVGGSDTFFDESATLNAEMRTRLGTSLRVGIDPLADNELLNFTVSQPLLRGFGTTINEAPVEQARLGESINQLDLRQSVITTVTQAITRYTGLIQAQQSVEIQAMAVERRQRELDRQRALVAAGWEAGASLFDFERLVADAQRQLIVAQNSLSQANSALLNLIGTDANLRFVTPPNTIDRLFATAEARAANLDLETLVNTAYEVNPTYLQAQLNQQSRELTRLIAEDNLRWQLNLQGTGNFGDFSRSRVGLVATRQFDDPALETQRVSSEVALQQGENRLAQLQENLRNDVSDRLLDVRANQGQVEAARRARESAARQLEAIRIRARQGNVSQFEVSQQEENLVTAQNNELNARIAFLNSIAALEQTVGITLESWAEQVDFEE